MAAALGALGKTTLEVRRVAGRLEFGSLVLCRGLKGGVATRHTQILEASVSLMPLTCRAVSCAVICAVCSSVLCCVPQVHQDYQGSGRPLPPDPLQFFAAMAPEPTQAAMDAAAATAGGGAAGGGPSSHMPLLQPQQLRGAAGGVGAPLSLLGEATAPFVGSEQQQAEGAPGSAGAKQAAGACGVAVAAVF